MKIIDKYKDYYDWLVSKYGIDPLICYDRRGSIKLFSRPDDIYVYVKQSSSGYTNTMLDNLFLYFSKNIIDSKNTTIFYSKDRWSSEIKYTDKDVSEIGKDNYGCFNYGIQIGLYLYIFEVRRYIENGKLKLIPKLITKKKKRYDFSNAPIYLFPMTKEHHYWFERKKNKDIVDNIVPKYKNGYRDETETIDVIENPILADTYIPTLISAEDIWCEVTEYLGNLKEKKFIDSRTNNEHIESAGFDKITSFRKM